MNCAGLILAAGRSRRMGSPKALLDLRGETFVDRLIAVFHEHCAPVVVVLGHEAEKVRAGIRRAAWASIVVNENYPLGQFSSLQSGLRALVGETQAVIFTPVDHPNIAAATVAQLKAGLDHGALVGVPRYQGRRGHPVAFASELIPEFLALPPDAQARDVIHRYSDRTCYIDVEDPGILDDIDDAEAYARLLHTVEPG